MNTSYRALVVIVLGMTTFTIYSPRLLRAQFPLGDVDGDADVDNFDLMIVLDTKASSALAATSTSISPRAPVTTNWRNPISTHFPRLAIP
jgi:hypothetical protein